MPKIKTKSSAKKRFFITANGKIKIGHAFKRHGMRKRSNRFLRNSKGTAILDKADTKNVHKFYLPNGVS
ncbi:MAG: 50S ribosomal protein L35 [Alphaproteobacteria bacterium]|nr:MAG: 50S ribosomal protein L35 [Alphaproteobacteria bacterium]